MLLIQIIRVVGGKFNAYMRRGDIIIGASNRLSHDWFKAITWINASLLSMWFQLQSYLNQNTDVFIKKTQMWKCLQNIGHFVQFSLFYVSNQTAMAKRCLTRIPISTYNENVLSKALCMLLASSRSMFCGIYKRVSTCSFPIARGLRLLISPRLVTAGLSLEYETLPTIGCHHIFIIGWSKYRLGFPGVAMHGRFENFHRFSDATDSPFAPAPSDRQMPAFRAVQRDCERVCRRPDLADEYIAVIKGKLGPFYWIAQYCIMALYDVNPLRGICRKRTSITEIASPQVYS